MEQLIYYKDNPNLGNRIVLTVRGETEYLANCRKFLEGYLVKGIDLKYDEVTMTWVKINNIVFDYELLKDVENSAVLSYGIVNISEDGTEVKGFFTPNVYRNCTVMDATGVTINCIDAAVLPDKYYREKLSQGIYYSIKNMQVYQISALNQRELSVDFNNKTYNIEDNPNAIAQVKKLYENSNFPIDLDLKQVAKYIGDVTFGVELETINGNLPQNIQNKYGVIICKDGSLRDNKDKYPPEYVTVPLSGAKGLQVLRNLPVEIAKRSDINIRCSYHLHLGGFAIDRVMMVSLFRLCRKIQKDVFKMFPLYKTQWKEYKAKNYCQKVPSIVNSYGTKGYNKYINDTYCDIYKFLTGGNDVGIEHNRKHKINPWGQNKWDIATRYYWINFVNPVFGKRDTIEFRIHTPTLNPDKIINWLLMCVAIVRFAETEILRSIDGSEVSFVDVLNWYKNHFKSAKAAKLSENLIAYYQNRIAYFKADADRSDKLSGAELLEDNAFKFNTTIL